jgi:acetyltransferase-like isoleucine patch superfamily enzyme
MDEEGGGARALEPLGALVAQGRGPHAKTEDRWRTMNFAAVGFDALLYVCNIVVANVPSVRLRHLFYRRVMQVELAPGSFIHSGLWLDCRRHLIIGENSVINQRCRLDARGSLTIGANVSISPEVHLITADHDIAADDLGGRTKPITIGDYVFIGSRAMVLPGVTIGEGAVVAAGAVVTKSVGPREVVAGIPARKIAMRTSKFNYNTKVERHFF